MPPDCGNCRACIANPDKVRYNGATKNKGGREMETEINNVQVEPVPYIAHESEMTRMERVNKRWFVAWLVTFIILMGCIVWFFWRESQFVGEETTTETYTSETDGGGTAIVNRDGSVIYGEGNIYPDNQADTNP